MKITLQQLVELNACEEQRILFAEHFGDKVEITEELCAEVAGDFSWEWAAGNLLDNTVCSEYNRAIAPARAEYNRAVVPALAKYNRAIAPMLAEYNRTIAPAWDEYHRAIAPARDERKRVEASAYSKFNRVKAITFARLYNAQG